MKPNIKLYRYLALGFVLIHLGVLTMAMGIISTELYQQQTQLRLARGESLSLGDYTMVFNGIEQRAGIDDAQITEASVLLLIGTPFQLEPGKICPSLPCE